MLGFIKGVRVPGLVRILLMLIVVALAGCVAEEEPEGPGLIGVCPQWVPGDARFEASRAGDDMVVEFAGNESLGQYSLDLVVFTFTSDGPVTIRAAGPDGNRLLFRHAGSDSAPSLVVDGEREAKVHLSPVEHGSTASPGPVTLRFEGAAGLQVIAEPFYKVCGVPGP